MARKKGSSPIKRRRINAGEESRVVAKKPKKSGPRGKLQKTQYEEGLDEIDEVSEDFVAEEEEEEEEETVEDGDVVISKHESRRGVKAMGRGRGDGETGFVGKPMPIEEAKKRWPDRYVDERTTTTCRPNKGEEINSLLRAKCHFFEAMVDGIIYRLDDDAYVKAEEGKDDYIGRIVEFFESFDNNMYFTCQWYFRAEDTVITKEHISCHDSRRVFLSYEKDVNILDCIVSKLKIVELDTYIVLAEKLKIPDCDFYYDMSYSPYYSTFVNLHGRTRGSGTSESDQGDELSLLDLYSGCGAMSTGICLGANLAGVNIRTCWAVDMNRFACQSLKLNHPDAEVRNEKAEDFFCLIKEWDNLCKEYGVLNENGEAIDTTEHEEEDEQDDDSSSVDPGEYEVEKVIGICFGKTENLDELGLKYKVRWKGYGPDDDTWEPAIGLSNCKQRIQAFVREGYAMNILPLPGRVGAICGGPPCQGASGFNRYRNFKNPLQDEKNMQIIVYMDIVDFLRPKYVLMENVVDIMKFSAGYLGKYALSRLINMKYQARLGIMAAGQYGLAQCRNRVFLWGARHNEILPQFPLGNYKMTARGVCPTEFERNIVLKTSQKLEEALTLGDTISDLPAVTNDEHRDEMSYEKPPLTDFQRCIRLSRAGLTNQAVIGEEEFRHTRLFDHRPLKLNEDDYQRVCRIPKKKGANFRDLPGVRVKQDNTVEFDPAIKRVLLPSGRPLVPDYAMTFVKGKSLKPFGRLWWDETVPTVVTRAQPHNQAILHPNQNRVLTIRENARLQGFPDYYQLCGPVKERYIQVGNAVAVPVSRSLGYALGLASKNECSDEPTFSLPKKFPLHNKLD